MGTRASLPAFDIAVGRRLKYPLSLASAKNHLSSSPETHAATAFSGRDKLRAAFESAKAREPGTEPVVAPVEESQVEE